MKNEAILKSLNIIKNGDMSELDFLIDAISKEKQKKVVRWQQKKLYLLW